MPQFRYRAVTQAGELVAGEVEAHSREEVMMRRIEYLGHLPIEAEFTNGGVFGRSSGAFGRMRPGAREITILLRQLALLVGAGMTSGSGAANAWRERHPGLSPLCQRPSIVDLCWRKLCRSAGSASRAY